MRREKSISVRFAAVGGQTVKAELREIGATGKSAMQGITTGSQAGSDGLEHFGMVAAQARMQLEAIAQKSAAAAAAMRTTASATSAMQSKVNQATGVTSPSGMSTVEILQQGQALDDLRAKFNPLYAVIRQYRGEVAEIRASHLEGAISASEMSTAIGKVRSSALATIDKLKGISAAAREKAAALDAAARQDADAAAAAALHGQRLDDMRAKLNPLYGVIRQYRSEVAAVRQAQVDGAVSADEAAAAIGRLRTSALATIDKLKGISAAAREKAAALDAAAKEEASAAAATAAHAQRLDDLRAKMNPLYGVIRQYRAEVAAVRQAQGDGAVSADEAAAAIARLRTSALGSIDKIKGLTAALREKARADDEAKASAASHAQQMDDLRARYNPVYAVIRRYKAEQQAVRQAHADGAISADELTASLNRLRTASLGQIAIAKGQTQQIEQMSRAARGGTLRMQQMFFQVNDIGVSLAGGMNPFIVMAQQGTQIAQIYGFGNGGVGGIFRDLGGLITGLPGPLKAVAAGVALGAIAVRGMQNEINKTSDITVTFGDTALAVFQVIGDRISGKLEPIISKIGDWFDAVWTRVVDATKDTGNLVIKGVQLAALGIKVAIDGVPGFFQSAFYKAVGYVQKALSDMAAGLWRFLQMAADGLNSVFNTNLTAPQGLNDAANGLMKSSAASFGMANDVDSKSFSSEFAAKAGAIMSSDPMGDFFNDVSTRAQDNARKRLEEEEGKSGRGGGKGRKAAAERDEVAELIKTLQEELAVLRETDPVKKRLLGYAEQMAGATASERQQIEDLVRSLDRAENGWEAVGRAMMTYSEESSRQGQSLGAAFVDAFGNAEDAFSKFVTTGKLEWRDMVNSMVAELARLTFQQHVTGPLSGMLGSWLGSFGSSGDLLTDTLSGIGLGASVPSYDGGGRTPNLPRHGGVDGKGGFYAIMHGNETIEDHTKPGGRRGGGEASRVMVGVDPKNGSIQAYVDQRFNELMPQAFDAYSRQALPYAIQQHLNDPRSVG